MCIYSYDAFLLLKFLKVINDFFAWDFKGLSQSAAKHTTSYVIDVLQPLKHLADLFLLFLHIL